MNDELAMIEQLMQENPDLDEDEARILYERLFGDDDD